MNLPTQDESPNGLHQKYIITHVDGSPVDPEAMYFVLRIDAKCKDRLWTRLCRKALRVLQLDLELIGNLPILALDIHSVLMGYEIEERAAREDEVDHLRGPCEHSIVVNRCSKCGKSVRELNAKQTAKFQ